jgi:hypothetical protein
LRFFSDAPHLEAISFLFHAQQRGVERALIELQQLVADLLDAPRDAITMQRSQPLQRAENQKNQSALKYFALVGPVISH